MRILLTVLALTFAAGLLYTLYHIGYVVPQQLDSIFSVKGSPAQQLADANMVVRKIFAYVSIEFIIALLLVITLAFYVNTTQKANIVYVERTEEANKHDENQFNLQINTDEYIVARLTESIRQLVAEATEGSQPQMLDKLLQTVCRAIEAVAGACFVCDSTTQTVRGVAAYALSHPLPAEPFEWGEGFLGQVARSGKPMYIHPVPENYLPVKTGLGQSRPASLLYLPVKEGGQTVGILELGMFKQVSENFLENLQKNIHLSSPLFGSVRMQDNSIS